jgi:hypothetical protein
MIYTYSQQNRSPVQEEFAVDFDMESVKRQKYLTILTGFKDTDHDVSKNLMFSSIFVIAMNFLYNHFKDLL